MEKHRVQYSQIISLFNNKTDKLHRISNVFYVKKTVHIFQIFEACLEIFNESSDHLIWARFKLAKLLALHIKFHSNVKKQWTKTNSSLESFSSINYNIKDCTQQNLKGSFLHLRISLTLPFVVEQSSWIPSVNCTASPCTCDLGNIVLLHQVHNRRPCPIISTHIFILVLPCLQLRLISCNHLISHFLHVYGTVTCWGTCCFE